MTARITSCHIYPVKSLKSITLDTMTLTPRGPAHDRRYMLVGARDNSFITQRSKGAEKLAIIETKIVDDCLIFVFPGGAEYKASPPDTTSPLIDTKVFKSDVRVQFVEGDINDALSDYLDQSVRLVYQPDHSIRPADSRFSREGDHVSLADGFPLLITNAASLDALNEHIAPDKKVTMDRFRPNIVLEGLDPFEEDMIKTIHIGDVQIDIAKPCARCKVTTIAQDKGIVAGDEPLTTLRKLRFGKDKEGGLTGMFFGMNGIVRKGGDVHRGQEINYSLTDTPFRALAHVELGYDNKKSQAST